MKRPTLLAVAVMAAGALVPATASAAKPSAASVTSHVQKAQGAQSRVATLVHRGDAKGARRVLKVARREAVAAARDAKSLAARAQSTANPATGEQAALALTQAAQNFGTALDQFAGLVPDASAIVQQLLANAIPGTVAGRDQLIQSLTDLVKKLQGDAQAIAAQGLAALQVALPTQVNGLADLANLDTLPASIAGIINSALAAATSALDSGLQALTAVIPNLPESLQGPITSALGMVSDLIEGIAPILQQTTSMVSGLITQVLGGLPDLLGGIVPGAIGGGTDAPSASSGLSSLFDMLSGLIPDFSGLFGGFFPGAPAAPAGA